MLIQIPDIKTYYSIYLPCYIVSLSVSFVGVTLGSSKEDSDACGKYFDFFEHALLVVGFAVLERKLILDKSNHEELSEKLKAEVEALKNQLATKDNKICVLVKEVQKKEK